MTAAYNASVAPGIRMGFGLGYTNNPTPVIYTLRTGSALNLLANVTTYW
jgi:porin